MGVAMHEFLNVLKEFDGVGKVVELEELRSLFSRFESGIKSADEVIKSLDAKKSVFGYVTLGDEPLGKVSSFMKEGNLDKLAKVAKSEVHIASSERTAFKELVEDNPVKRMGELREETETLQKTHPELDVPVSEMDKLSSTSKQSLSKISENLFKVFKKGSKILLTLGAVYVGVDWLKKATEARRGCFMLTTINNKTASCKVKNFTCGDSPSDTWCGNENIKNLYNVTLILMHIVQLDDTEDIKNELAKSINMEVKDLNSKFKEIISNSYDKAAQFVTKLEKKPTINVCGLSHPDVEENKIPECRMCDPTSNPISTQYIDTSQLPINVTFQCNVNPSILDTLADLGKHTAIDIWDGVTNTIFAFLKPIAIFVIVMGVLITIIGFIAKSLFRHKTQMVSTAYVTQPNAMLYNNQLLLPPTH